MPPTPEVEVAEAGRQVALYVTELEARRPLTVGEDYLVKKQRADDENTREILKWNDVLSQQLTQSSDSGDELTVHVQKLLSRWKNFESECLSEKHRKEFANDSPDVQSVSKVIQSLTIHYQTNHDQTTTSTNKVVRSLRRMGQGMNAHKTMLQIVPSGNNYAAIICGVVQTIIRVGAVDSPLAPADVRKAAATHHRITDAIAREIAEINDNVASCVTLLDLYPNERMHRLTVELYCHIFDFFERIVQWLKSRWQRFRRSFSDDSIDTLNELTADIKRHIEALHRNADVGQKVEGRLANLGINQLQRQVASQAEYLEKTWALVNELNSPQRQQEMMTQISVQMFHLLQGKDWLHTNMNAFLRNGDDMSVCETIEDSHSPFLLPQDSRSRALSDTGSFSDEAFDPFDRNTLQPVHVDAMVVGALQNWLSVPRTTFLWTTGPTEGDDNDIARSVAQAFVRSTVQSGTPIIWHSCVVREADSQQNALTTSFQRLLRALVQQLIRLSRPTRPPSPRYSPSLGSQHHDTVENLLEQFEAQLSNAPPVLFCSIDDFQLLDDPAEDNTHLLEFLKVLRKYGAACAEQTYESRIFKVLFTTKGQSWALTSELDPDEVCSAGEDWRTSQYPGEEAPGRLPINLEPSISNLSL
jgi:hypothetical protein